MSPKFNADLFGMGNIILVKKLDKGDFAGGLIYREQLKNFKEKDAVWTHVVVSGGPNRAKDKIYAVNIGPPKACILVIGETFAGRYIKVLQFRDKTVDRARVAYFAASLCNRGYDFLGVLKFKIKILFHRVNKFFCSEGTLWAIRWEIPDFFAWLEEYECMPAHFSAAEVQELEVVYEGFLPKEV